LIQPHQVNVTPTGGLGPRGELGGQLRRRGGEKISWSKIADLRADMTALLR
jgi:hypothetical protein